MSAPTRVGRPPETTEPVAPEALPEPVTENLEKAEARYQQSLDATACANDLDPAIKRLDAELAALKNQKASLGRTATKHLDDAKVYHRMAMGWCAERRWEPQPLTFDAMAAVLDQRQAERVSSGNPDTRPVPAAKIDALNAPIDQVT